MWQDKLKEIIYILENSNVNEIEVNFWGRKYRVSKSGSLAATSFATPVQTSEPLLAQSETDDSQHTKTVESVANGENLLSPMPGTFYSSPTPDDPPFVSKGDSVKKGQTLCIIEAMKIMNEIEAEIDGTITEVMVGNGDPVEYNQTLFIINPV
ncbi:MAG: acetyl-CoA carboxylase biotin carboxyl carrier protein [Candidatus Neomarinimicrobiota bacterium]|nr:acetyl-CoA carboxylase biotin carboxyl carrier protein [Candidatus Neomarinimicrobiota bacterium]